MKIKVTSLYQLLYNQSLNVFLLILMFTLLLAPSLLSNLSFAQSLLKTKKSDSGNTLTCKQITIGGHPSYPPIEWVVHNQVEGAGVNIAKAIFNKLNIAVTTKNLGSIPAMLDALQNNPRVNMTTSIFYAAPRTQYLHYIQPAYAYDELAVFTRKGETFSFHSWHDLKNKKGASTLGSTTGNPELDQILNDKLQVQPIQRINLAFHKLAKYRIDYVIAPKFTGIIEIKKEFSKTIIALDKPFSAAGIYFAFAKRAGCKQLYQRFSQELTQMIQQGKIKQLINQAYASYAYQDRLGIITKEYDESEK
ncbi:cystine transporter subunit [Piscirickettsia salmonis]|uniref:substrate-binding periplasmic protein n=1 Tax=Piscirickettsia salmonis TaxID=1238 RepID=UPI0012BA6460|nr:transporter substrate-binding domain-containing protein [Piscirickettsia salmonis]QGP56199.1 cystine transporter subunit [Piscirickettsia salmonis]QGP57924.1 cystine transporter subunit [Piscirickettsia salmonis]QGP65768.1 cystine transporter subunit [Piscirickettsia salmonis]